jgi:hypothetical protein
MDTGSSENPDAESHCGAHCVRVIIVWVVLTLAGLFLWLPWCSWRRCPACCFSPISRHAQSHAVSAPESLSVAGGYSICPSSADYLGLEAVAHSSLGDDVARPSRIILEFLSEGLDVLT